MTRMRIVKRRRKDIDRLGPRVRRRLEVCRKCGELSRGLSTAGLCPLCEVGLRTDKNG
jgi:rubrerythrin